MARTGEHRRDAWTLLAYFAGRYTAPVATYCVLSAATPLLLLAAAAAGATFVTPSRFFCMLAALSPAAVGVISFQNLWHLLFSQRLTVDAAPLLRISGSGRNLYWGLAGAIWVWVLAGWAAGIPPLAFLAVLSGEGRSIAAAALAGLGTLLVFQTIVLPVRVMAFTRPIVAQLLTVVLFCVFIVAVPTGFFFLPMTRAWLLPSTIGEGVAVLAVGGGVAIVGNLLVERWFSGVRAERFGYITKDIRRKQKTDKAAEKKAARSRRKSKNWRTSDPAFERAFGSVVYGGAGRAVAVMIVFGLCVVGYLAITADSWNSVTLRDGVVMVLSLTAGAIAILAGAVFTVGPMQAVAREREDYTLGPLVLAMGLRNAVRSTAAGVVTGSAVLAVPAGLWFAFLLLWAGLTVVPTVYLFLIGLLALSTLVTVYGIWAAIRADTLNRAIAFVLVAVLLSPMLLAGPLLLNRQLDREHLDA